MGTLRVLSTLLLALCSVLAAPSSVECHRRTLTGSRGKCIDGSDPVYYYRRGSGEGSGKWQIHLQGGGWCFSPEDCYRRSKTVYGSSVTKDNWATPEAAEAAASGSPSTQCADSTVGSIMLNSHSYLAGAGVSGAMDAAGAGGALLSMADWNTVLVKYCDGGSFAGDAEGEFKGNPLRFHGASIRREVIAALLAEDFDGGGPGAGAAAAGDAGGGGAGGGPTTWLSLRHAGEVVVSGCSAGGLALYLGIDTVVRQIRSANPGAMVRGLADSGYFLYFGDSDVAALRPAGAGAGAGTGSQPARYVPRDAEYGAGLLNVARFMNFSGSSGTSAAPASHSLALQACMTYYRAVDRAASAEKCVFPQFLVPFVRTPTFHKQTQYDYWQIDNILRVSRRSAEGGAAIDKYGTTLAATLIATAMGADRGCLGADGHVLNHAAVLEVLRAMHVREAEERAHAHALQGREEQGGRRLQGVGGAGIESAAALDSPWGQRWLRFHGLLPALEAENGTRTLQDGNNNADREQGADERDLVARPRLRLRGAVNRGAGGRGEVFEPLLLPPHAAFVDSCESHCSVCVNRRPNEMWAGSDAERLRAGVVAAAVRREQQLPSPESGAVVLGAAIGQLKDEQRRGNQQEEAVAEASVRRVEPPISPSAAAKSGYSAMEAFSEWYGYTSVLQHHPSGMALGAGGERMRGREHNQRMHKMLAAYQYSPGRRVYLQSRPYPCYDCCECAAVFT